MCIEFVKSEGRFDCFSTPVNLIGNGLVLTGATIGLGLISAAALKALGYSAAALAVTKTLTIIGATIGIGMVGVGVVGIVALAVFMVQAVRQWKR